MLFRSDRAENLFDISIGKTPPRKQSQWFSENPQDIGWLSIRDMGVGNVFTSQTSEYLTPEAVKKHNVKIVPTGTILLSFKLTLGRVQIASSDICTNEAIAHFKQTDKSPDFTWIYGYLKGFDYSSLGSTSSIATAVNSQTIKKMPILQTNSSLEKIYANNVSFIFDRIKINEQESQSLAETRDALLPKLLSGEIDVNKVDA